MKSGEIAALLAFGLVVSSLFSCGGSIPTPTPEEDLSWIEFDGEEPLSEDFTYSYHPEVGGYVIEDYRGEKADILLPETTTQDGVKGPVAGIAAYAFYKRTNLRSLALPYSIRYLGDYCFAESGLENLYVTGNITHAAEHAFDGFSPRVYSKDGVSYLPTRETKYGFAFAAPGLEKGRKKSGKDRASVTLPSGCVGIRDHLFDDLEVEVTLPQSVEMLGTITAVPESKWDEQWETWYTWPKGVSSIKITKFALDGVEGNSDYEAPFIWNDVSRIDIQNYFGDIPNCCFAGFKGKVLLGDDIFSFGNFAFYEYRYEEFTFPKSLKSIGYSCFRDSSLKTAVFPEGFEEIGRLAFDCSRLTYLTLPSTLKKIGKQPFGACPLSEITIPASVTELDPEAFGWSNLKMIDLSKTKFEEFDYRSIEERPNLDSATFVFPITAKKIHLKAEFTLFYAGSEEQFQSVTTSYTGKPYYYSEEQPSSGRYWRYVEGKPVAW